MRFTPRWLVSSLVSLAPLCGALAQQRPAPAEPFPRELDDYVAKALTDWHIPGIAVGVVRNDSVLVAKGYGVRELGKPDPVTEHTVFDIASLTKSFTATAVAMLVDRGVLKWDDPVRRYRPDLVLPTEELTERATVRDFLSHRTGLDPANMMWVITAVDREEVLRRMRNLKAQAAFRSTMVYSNIGYTVAGEAAAAAANTPFELLLRDYVIKAIRLPSTTWTYDQVARMPNVATSHATIAGRQQPVPRETQRQPVAAAAAVQSTVSDLARWMRLHLNNGVLDGKRFVSESAMREMHSVQVGIATTPAMRAARMVQDTVIGYGMGWQIVDYRGHPMLWHTGNANGQIAYMALLPRERLGVVVLVNTWSAPNVHAALINRMLDVYLGYEPRDWVAESMARAPAMDAARDSVASAMVAMRSTSPPPVALDRYIGRYDNDVFGPIHIRKEAAGLTLQMGDGQVADLEYHGRDRFFTRWRDPFFREYFGTHVFLPAVEGRVDTLRTQLNRDTFVAVRTR